MRETSIFKATQYMLFCMLVVAFLIRRNIECIIWKWRVFFLLFFWNLLFYFVVYFTFFLSHSITLQTKKKDDELSKVSRAGEGNVEQTSKHLEYMVESIEKRNEEKKIYIYIYYTQITYNSMWNFTESEKGNAGLYY